MTASANPSSCILVLVTATDAAEAARIGDALLEDRLAACVSCVDGLRSMFWWQGVRDSAAETLLMIKTRAELWEPLLARLREVHSYEVFEAIALPVLFGNPDYLDWVVENTAK